jgi:hypothetical protein
VLRLSWCFTWRIPASMAVILTRDVSKSQRMETKKVLLVLLLVLLQSGFQKPSTHAGCSVIFDPLRAKSTNFFADSIGNST